MNDLSMSNARSSDTNGPDLCNVQDWDNMVSTVVLPHTIFILSWAVQIIKNSHGHNLSFSNFSCGRWYLNKLGYNMQMKRKPRAKPQL